MGQTWALCYGLSMKKMTSYSNTPSAPTGGVSYTVGGAAAPPTLSSATPTEWLATPIFNGFWSYPASKCWGWPRAVPRYQNLRCIDIKNAHFHVKAIGQCHFCPTNFAKEAPPMSAPNGEKRSVIIWKWPASSAVFTFQRGLLKTVIFWFIFEWVHILGGRNTTISGCSEVKGASTTGLFCAHPTRWPLPLSSDTHRRFYNSPPMDLWRFWALADTVLDVMNFGGYEFWRLWILEVMVFEFLMVSRGEQTNTPRRKTGEFPLQYYLLHVRTFLSLSGLGGSDKYI